MRIISMLIISLMIGACSGHTSTTTMAECANDGSGGDGCINDQAALKVEPLFSSRKRRGKTCGDRIKAEEVMVIDLESPEGIASLEQVGPYVLLTESMLSIASMGSMVKTVRAATDFAASRGCNLLLTGPFISDSVKSDRAGTPSPNNGTNSSPVRLQKYLLVRMARLQ